jgi:hypothetical protein
LRSLDRALDPLQDDAYLLVQRSPGIADRDAPLRPVEELDPDSASRFAICLLSAGCTMCKR